MHVLNGHPEISRFIEDVLVTVRLYVVVDWEAGEPHIVTAYGKRKGPV